MFAGGECSEGHEGGKRGSKSREVRGSAPVVTKESAVHHAAHDGSEKESSEESSSEDIAPTTAVREGCERPNRKRKQTEFPGMVGETPKKKRTPSPNPQQKRTVEGTVKATRTQAGGELRHLIRVGKIMVRRIERDEDDRAKRRRR